MMPLKQMTPELEAARLELWIAKKREFLEVVRGENAVWISNLICDAEHKLSRLRAMMLVRADKG